MFTTTKDLALATTVTGSWPRPTWYTANLGGRPFSSAMTDLSYREQHVDAVSALVTDQEYAGLDILTNGDYHLDAELGGRSWIMYPLQRIGGVTELDLEASDPIWAYHKLGTWLYEIVNGWRYPKVVGRIEPRIPLELAKIWRVIQARAQKPVRLGTISGDLAASVMTVGTDVYKDDKRELMWDMATLFNQELRELAAAGCQAIQLDDPLIYVADAVGEDEDVIDFMVDVFNHQVEGLDDVEIWIHTCWGNAGAQRSMDAGYESAVDVMLNRIKGDVWTIESKDAGHAPLPLFAPYKGRLPKKIAAGFVNHRTVNVESAEEVADDVRGALEYIDPEHLILSSDCGFGREGIPRSAALYKAAALSQGANIVRRELGLPETPVPAANPDLQIDIPGRALASSGGPSFS
jgi:5-methyltetrahydropteroyltriglutamate--homocysteine methyltransferase